MKHKNKPNRYPSLELTSCLLWLLVYSMSSCSNKKDEIQPADLTALSITIAGIEEEELDLSFSALSASTGKPNVNIPPENQEKSLQVQSFKDFDVITSVENGAYKRHQGQGHLRNLKKNVRPESSSIHALNAQAVRLADSIRYVILLYGPDGLLYTSETATSGRAISVDVIRGDTYRWIAYSYNESANNLPEVTDPANPIIPTGQNKDLLYASGDITISDEGNTPLPITFQHSMTRVAVELNTMGMFADLNAASVTIGGTNFRSGTIDLRTGRVTPTGPAFGISGAQTTFQRPPNYTFGDRNLLYFYTADSSAIASLPVTLNSLSINLDVPNTTRSFTAPQTFNFQIPISQMGRSKTARLDLIESPLTVAGTRWARSNIYYQEGHNPYRFRHLNPASTARNTFWPWRALTPTAAVGSGDPCRQVYPANVWRTPTPAELNSLNSGAATRTFQTGNVQYAASGTASPYPTNNLIIRYNGQTPSVTLLGVVNLEFALQEETFNAYLWSDDPTISLIGLVEVGLTHYRAGRRPFLGGLGGLLQLYEPSPTSTIESTLINVSALGLGAIHSGYRNVRCVRNDT